MAIFGKTNWLARKSIIAYGRNSRSKTDKGVRLTLRQSVRLASNLDGVIFARQNVTKQKNEICFSC